MRVLGEKESFFLALGIPQAILVARILFKRKENPKEWLGRVSRDPKTTVLSAAQRLEYPALYQAVCYQARQWLPALGYRSRCSAFHRPR